MVPLTARFASWPIRHEHPIPIRTNPICDMDEHASVLLRFVENSAINAPRNMVMVPRISITVPQRESSAKT